jgi:predicted DNA-binding transcriptional regulator AlpA
MSKRKTSQPADDEEWGISPVERATGRDRSTIWRWYRVGRFPEPHYIGDRRMWRRSEVEAWIRAQLARPASARRNNLGAYAQPKAARS